MAVLWCLLSVVLYGLGDSASIPERSNTDYDTIVVGLGASGAGAASVLARGGRRVLALEGHDWVGGRAHTAACGDGAVEMGAEWVHGVEGSPTYKLAVENNITLLPQELEEGAVWSDGEALDSTLVGALMNVTMEASDEAPEPPESVGGYTTKRIMAYLSENHPDVVNNTEFVNEFLSFADLIMDTYTGSDSWTDASTASRYQQLGGNQDMSWHRYGYKALFGILLNLNDSALATLKVKLSTEVTQITWPQEKSGKVVVKTKDGGEYTADNAIVTVSVGVLKERHATLFSPQLPPKKVTAIDTISLGVVNKIILFFADRWWPHSMSVGFLWKAEDKKKVPEGDRWMTKIAGVSPSMGCNYTLTLWSNGEAARFIETIPEDVLKVKSTELLRKFLGSHYTIPEPTEVLRSTWYSDPFTRGSYSFENLLTPTHPTNRADLAEPLTDSSGQPRVLFAGEASNPIHFSTVHGALETGYREASRLLDPTPTAINK